MQRLKFTVFCRNPISTLQEIVHKLQPWPKQVLSWPVVDNHSMISSPFLVLFLQNQRLFWLTIKMFHHQALTTKWESESRLFLSLFKRQFQARVKTNCLRKRFDSVSHIFSVPMVSEQCLIQNSIWGIMVLLNERKRNIDKITTKWHLSVFYSVDESLLIEESCLEISSGRKPKRREKWEKEGRHTLSRDSAWHCWALSLTTMRKEGWEVSLGGITERSSVFPLLANETGT